MTLFHNIAQSSSEAPHTHALDAVIARATREINQRLVGVVESLSVHRSKDHLLSALFPGKRIRPLIVYLGVERILGEVPASTLNLSIALELIHRASLLVDDIVDLDTERASHPTFHTRWGVGAASVISHQLVSGALRIVADQNVQQERSFIQAYYGTCDGQLADMGLKTNRRASHLLFYLEEVAPKTASLFALAASLICGSTTLTGDDAANLTEQCKLFGRYYQAANDIAELEHICRNPSLARSRPVRNTLPVAVAMDMSSDEDHAHLVSAFEPNAGAEQYQLAWQVLTSTRNIERTRQAALTIKGALRDTTRTSTLQDFGSFIDVLERVALVR